MPGQSEFNWQHCDALDNLTMQIPIINDVASDVSGLSVDEKGDLSTSKPSEGPN